MAPDADTGLPDECTLILDSDGIDAFHQFIARAWRHVERVSQVEPDREFAFSLMLGELVANVARHAYAGTPERDRWLRVRIDVTDGCVRAEVRDRGRPFEGAHDRLATAGQEEHGPDQESGRGLRILVQLADSIEYDRTGTGENVWRVTTCLA